METTQALTFSSLFSCSYPSSSFETDWAWLPQDMLLLVLSKLLLLSDMIRFGSVCSHWRSVAKHRFQELNLRPNMHFNRNLPMLLLPTAENNTWMCRLFSIPHREIYDLHMQLPYSKRYCGSSHGWVIILDDSSFVISLVNPFYFGSSKGIIYLPPFIAALDTSEETGENFNCEHFVSKAILSSDPFTSPNDYALMLIYGERRMLAFWKSGDTHWTYFSCIAPIFCDLLYSRGQFLAVDIFGQVYSCDIDVNPQLNKVSDPVSGIMGTFGRRYIVELPDGTILQIIRFIRDFMSDEVPPIRHTIGFLFHKLLDNNGTKNWFHIRSLEDGALFLGDTGCLYVKASLFPGCESDSVYFTDDFQERDTRLIKSFRFSGRCDIYVFHLPDEFFLRICSPLTELSAPPIWIMPTI